MDLQSLGIDAAFVLCIVGVAQVVKKKVLERRKLGDRVPLWVHRRYKELPVLVILIGASAAALAKTRPLEWQGLLEQFMKIGSAATFLYATGKLAVGSRSKPEGRPLIEDPPPDEGVGNPVPGAGK
jgi:hypothetical protein